MLLHSLHLNKLLLGTINIKLLHFVSAINRLKYLFWFLLLTFFFDRVPSFLVSFGLIYFNVIKILRLKCNYQEKGV